MKKIIAFLLAAMMLLTLAACGEKKGENGGEAGEGNSTDTATVGQTLLADFKADTTGTALQIAERVIGNKIIPFMGGAMAIEQGLLSGFDNTEIKGFKEGATFGPMMGSIAFVGYIFELEEGADVEAFKTTLKNSANLRWNICVEAEELVVENEGNKVFFLMCPKSFEQPETEEEGVAGDMGAVGEDMIPAEDGITLE